MLLVSERKPKKADPSQGALEGETQFPLYKNPKTGETYEKVIDATGTRRDDKLAADLAAGIEREKLPEAVTWHHAGFDPSTGKMKMQLVQRPPHAAEGHTGGFAEFLDWAAETLNSGNLKNLTAAQARALANALHSGDTMRQLGPRLSKLGIETAYEGATLVIKKGKSTIARTLTREVAGKTIRMIMKAGAVLFVISAAAEVKAAGADDWQVVQAAMREMVSADVWEAGFSFTVVAGAEVVSNAVSPPPATARAQRQRLSQLSAAQRREEVRKLRATFNFVQTEQWARMNGSLQKSLDAMKKTWDTISSGKAQK